MQNLAGNVPVYLVVLGLVAAFLVLRLRSILGKRTGLERPIAPQPVPSAMQRRGPSVDTTAQPIEPATDRRLPDPSTGAGIALARLRERDRGFDPEIFLRQAEDSFRRIVRAFAEGDRSTLRSMLTADAFAAFDQAITAREQAGETQRSEIRAVTQVRLDDVQLTEQNGTWRAALEVRFTSDQISVLMGRDGLPVSGADAVTELVDIWIFERLLDVAPQPGAAAWRLAVARNA
ncbi:Tim44/TimA family putative adaptor protein [Acetobacteraceae bacterium KSS8]|uniref:Large ribosomal subunit protein mL45 n=1 Tax=Endosaccharibacter trunci TaxID=2812733 RepID=A0ABT1W7Q4_9PROT|nr:Tim44/TimA family putative adaptor protein [Acetobacteraceae bacterium KSS8]